MDGGCINTNSFSKVIWNNSRGEESSIYLTFSNKDNKEYVITKVSFTVNEGKTNQLLTQNNVY